MWNACITRDTYHDTGCKIRSMYHGTEVCHLRKRACTEHCPVGGTVAHMHVPLQVSWHTWVTFLAVSTPSPRGPL